MPSMFGDSNLDDDYAPHTRAITRDGTFLKGAATSGARATPSLPVAAPATTRPEVVGLFSVGADGHLCFHKGSIDPVRLCDTLDESVTGGPYSARVAYAGPVIEKPSNG